MVRVLQVFARLGRGGLEAFIMNLYRNIDREKVQFDFLLSGDGGDYEEEVIQMGGHIYKIPARNEGLMSYYKNLDSFFRQHKGDWIAIHQHASSLSSIEPLYFAKKYGIKIRIIHAHSSSISSSLKTKKAHLVLHEINKKMLKHVCTDFFGCSDKAIHWLFDNTGIENRVVKINNGIECAKYAYNKNLQKEVRSEFNVEDTTVLIGHIGSFIPVKNHHFLLHVFKAYHDTNGDSKLMLIGDGPLKDNIIKLARELNVENNVIFTGIRKDVYRLLQAIDIIVMPSIYEGLPVSLVEAQAAGVPVLASNTISQDSKLIDEFVFLGLDEDTQSWAEVIHTTLNHYNKTNKSDIVVEKGYDINSSMDIIMNTYKVK